MTEHHRKTEFSESLVDSYLQYVRNPGTVETVGILYWKLRWWRIAKNFLKDVSKVGWIGGHEEYFMLFGMLRGLIDLRGRFSEPAMRTLWMWLADCDANRLKEGPDAHRTEDYWQEQADWLFLAMYQRVFTITGSKIGRSN